MPSPKPLPVETKKRRGTLEKSRQPAPLAIVAPAPRDLEPPPTLADMGAQEWRHVLTHCRWIAPSDLTVLRHYCEALDRRSGLMAELAEQGTVLYTDKGYAYLNPAHGALATTETQITKWLSLLGLSPSDRGRLGVAEVKARTKIEELAERAARRQAGRPAS